MTRTALHPPQEPSGPAFADSEGLRAVLMRLHEAGPGAWRHDPEAAELMRFAADRYAALARKYDQEPADAAVAAFEAMRNTSTRSAADPWAVVTVAVRITLIAEHRAHGLLTSTDRARRPQYSVFHDAERFSDRESELTEYHPAFHVPPHHHNGNGHQPDDVSEVDVWWVVEQTARLLVLLGWPAGTAWTLVEHVCARLADIGDRHNAYETLRRDKALRANLDLPHQSWIGLLRLTLGHPTGTGALRHGVLARLLVGDRLADLLDDDDLVLTAVAANPAGGGRGG
ncbi:hypothetical protein H5398_07785 [Tessaracoccus sp. MC1679]|uniref:hypothetical protein n=1 Tax=Tessaracoccus sp. MC1679 TaxID=2760313 RepID=UPI0015FEF5B1|nr:hypothetical protein [Tessaracoccus sp. MC1679]MBB1515869.1 hypothetical protein [Tessaracoccus sp. MC1679]